MKAFNTFTHSFAATCCLLLILLSCVESTEISIDEEAFSYFDMNEEKWMHGSGNFNILVGSSSKEILLMGEIEI